ncbi:dUTP diphosphatase [Lactococcus insecticola]|uniref:dUTP diphosphatase n=1 Tax=Pseudolactococcus insecticola TaxID=2709158 RepID=A0A6A0B9E0_9LACT|nr:deoxyuridine 5'-triphosphate nucleotidohydrolase [Lactococcus insecticola]GFH41426.1 putative deoxyuridine 5'-triphosphate nucleotidohydrolase YncF [Lactococcus insecticola]
MQIKIKYKNSATAKLKEIEQGDWIDLAIDEDIQATAQSKVSVDLGIAMQLPKGYEAHIVPRSSTYNKYGLILGNSTGIIDNSYNGPEDYWGAKFFATESVEIPKGTRLLQFRLVKTQKSELKENIHFVENNLEENTNRGGFGSTGN